MVSHDSAATPLPPRSDAFVHRHIGPSDADVAAMLATLNARSLDDLTDKAIPQSLRWNGRMEIPPAKGEIEALHELRDLANRNRVFRSYLGMGYHDCITPPVVQRNILENPGWY